MSMGAAFLSSIKLTLSNHPVCFFNFILIALSAGFEQIYANFVFKCPEDFDMAKWYGWIFLFAPVFILLICGIILNNNFWRVFHGCKKRSSTAEITSKESCKSFWNTVLRSSIIPSTWLFASLLDGDYYACSASETPHDISTFDYKRCKTISQLSAWIFLSIVVAFGAIVKCCGRCLDSKTYLEAQYADTHKLEENVLLEEKMKEIARKEIEKNLNTLFMENIIPSKEAWDKITAVESGDKSKTFYTTLHQWGSENKREDNKTNKQEMTPV